MIENLVQFAVAAIARYLQHHPDAADTVDGIHQWWIEWPGPPEPKAITRAALKRLEENGVMERRPVAKCEYWRRRR